MLDDKSALKIFFFHIFLLLINMENNIFFIISIARCDSVETAELLGGQLKALASHSDNSIKINSTDNRVRNNLGSDGRSTRESESSEGSGEHRHVPAQSSTIYESLAAELRAKLGLLFNFFSCISK